MSERERIEIPVNPTRKDDTLIAEIRALQEQILARREGQPVDVDALLDQMREERHHQT